jgi:hypothetical protein
MQERIITIYCLKMGDVALKMGDVAAFEALRSWHDRKMHSKGKWRVLR